MIRSEQGRFVYYMQVLEVRACHLFNVSCMGSVVSVFFSLRLKIDRTSDQLMLIRRRQILAFYQ